MLALLARSFGQRVTKAVIRSPSHEGASSRSYQPKDKLGQAGIGVNHQPQSCTAHIRLGRVFPLDCYEERAEKASLSGFFKFLKQEKVPPAVCAFSFRRRNPHFS